MKIGNLKVKPDNSAVPGGNGSVAETVGATALLNHTIRFGAGSRKKFGSGTKRFQQ